jgi:hypothetical protein
MVDARRNILLYVTGKMLMLLDVVASDHALKREVRYPDVRGEQDRR